MTTSSGPFNYPLLWAMFLSSVLLMFLFCYCMQKAMKKPQDSINNPSAIPLSETQTTGIQTIESCTFTQTSFHEETPPPSYENITSQIKGRGDQDVVGDLVDVDTEESSPPSYNTAIAMMFSTEHS